MAGVATGTVVLNPWTAFRLVIEDGRFMLRSVTSVCILLGCLLLVNKWIYQSGAAVEVPRGPRPALVPAALPDPVPTVAPPVAPAVGPAAETAAPSSEAVETGPLVLAPVRSSTGPDPTTANTRFTTQDDRVALDERTVEAARGSSGNAALSAELAVTPPGAPRAEPSPERGLKLLAVAGRAAPPLSPEMADLSARITQCLEFYFTQHLDAGRDSAWSMMHSFIGHGPDTLVRVPGPEDRTANAIGWLCWNGPCAGVRMLYARDGLVYARIGPGLQGHPGQFLAMLAQSRVQIDSPMKVDGRDFTTSALVEQEKLTCQPHMELTFKLIGLSHYLDSEATWQNEHGQTWDIPTLIRLELAQPINGAACGGTHRLMGFSYAVRKRVERGGSLTGQWLRASKFIHDYHQYALSLQNPDGSFSSEWLRGRGDWGGINRKIQTTGHVLEWLVYSLPQDELQDPRVVKTVNFLVNLMIENRYHRWEVGPQGHAMRALRLFQERLEQRSKPADPQRVARLPDGESVR